MAQNQHQWLFCSRNIGYLTLKIIYFHYRSVDNTWACYVTLRLHMPTEFEKNRFRYVTLGPKMPMSKKKKIVTLRNDVICTRPISTKKLVSLRNDVK